MELSIAEPQDSDPRLITLVIGDGGDGHVFGVNKTSFTPSQVSVDGYYVATIITTYAESGGAMINVFSDNPEITTVGIDDVLSMAGI